MAAAKNQKNRWSDKVWRDAIRVAVLRAHEGGGRNLAALANRLVNEALAGDISALKEIGDRLDGRPAQALEHSGADGGPLVITWER